MLIGAVVGAVGCFVVSRYLAAEAAESLARQAFQRSREWLDRRGFVAVMYTRIAPLPYSLMSYVGSLAQVRLPIFTAATAIGVLPRI